MASVDLDRITLRSFLFEDSASAAAAITGAVDERGIPGVVGAGMGRAARGLAGPVRAEITRAVQGLLEIDLGDVLLEGWRKWERLAAAAPARRPSLRESATVQTHGSSPNRRRGLLLTVSRDQRTDGRAGASATLAV
jgi:hypothetical protein